MKHVTRLFSLIILVSAGLFYASCDGGDDEKSQEELQLEKMQATWTLQSVVNDGTDRTDEYPGMTITISGTFGAGGTYNYSSDADSWPDASPWKAIDTWKFKTGSIGNVIVRQNDLVEMTYSLTNSDQTLSINFDYTTPGFVNGRTESVSGDWTFTFSRQ